MAVRYEERRRFQRVNVDCRVEFHHHGSADVHQGRGMDLSATGIQFSTEQELEIGTMLELNVLPDRHITPPLSAVAEVLRVVPAKSGRRYEVACRFTDMKD